MKVGIIGGGPRALWAAEELFELARQRSLSIDLTVFNDGILGATGPYALKQPQQWLVNVPHDAITTRCGSFAEWTDAPHPAPRTEVGRFLVESWRALIDHTPRRCTFEWVVGTVASVAPDGDRWQVSVADESMLFDEILLATGHAHDWPGSLAHSGVFGSLPSAGERNTPRLIAPATVKDLRTVTSDDVVVVRGAALTFIDIARVIDAAAIYPVSRSGRFMEVKADPGVEIEDLLDVAMDAIRNASDLTQVIAAIETFAVGILARAAESAGQGAASTAASTVASTATSTAAVRSVLAGTDKGDPVEDLRASVAGATGRGPLTAGQAVGLAFRKAYPALIERASFGGRDSLAGAGPEDEFAVFTRRMERVAFGPFVEPAADLLSRIDAGVIRPDLLGRGGSDEDLLAAAHNVGATVVIDGVIAPPGVIPGTLVHALVDAGIGVTDPSTRALRIERDGTLAGQRHIAAVGRATEGVVLGLDTLNRTQHDEIPRWARRVAARAAQGTPAADTQPAHGIPPLTARTEPWVDQLVADYLECDRLLTEFSSPINVLNPGPMLANVDELVTAGADCGVEVKVFFARKANKGLVFVDTVRDAAHGVDVASFNELSQVLGRGVPGERIIVSAAVKTDALLRLAIDNGVVISVDNATEYHRVVALAREADRVALIAPRLAPDPATMPPTRFGERSDQWRSTLRETDPSISVRGVHVHLHGYAAADRSAALRECMVLIDDLRSSGHIPKFIDVGGGVPMSYLDDEEQWRDYHDARDAFLYGYADPFTWKSDPLNNTYPFYQRPTRGPWLKDVLSGGVAEDLRARGLRLHLEPGRSLLDGCGVILARVEFVKTRSDGLPLVGLAMNRTQCRTTSDDYLVDPILIPRPDVEPRSDEVEAFLVGAYCIEDELILRRRIRFPQGVAPGDIIAIPNAAGYFMHILESASHQIPLAKNVVWPPGELDAIDRL
ncbi:FAD/NAD(P)-binding protein [Corynebacterium aquatimens]|nr:FAD/NAD(P)-binding protein [Corynebacterium aquatimens]